MRRKEVANSLLKILEEPPAQTVFILTGDEAGEILPTILSRCQIIPFYALAYEELAGVLEKEGVDPGTAETLAAVAEGSLGRARHFAKQNLLALRRKIVEGLLHLKADDPDSVEMVFELAEESAVLKEDLDDLLDLLSIWIRDVMLVCKGAPDQAISKDVFDLLPAAAQRWNIDSLSEHLSLLNSARDQLQRNCTRSLVCEVLFFAML